MFECKFGNKRYVIEHDVAVWYYQYVYNFDDKEPHADYLQDTLYGAKEFALDEFNVPLSCWVNL